MVGYAPLPLDAGERAVIAQLHHKRTTADGDIIGKSARGGLIRKGLAFRSHGMTTLTFKGSGWQTIAAWEERQGYAPTTRSGWMEAGV